MSEIYSHLVTRNHYFVPWSIFVFTFFQDVICVLAHIGTILLKNVSLN